jgi:hypothetical protein
MEVEPDVLHFRTPEAGVGGENLILNIAGGFVKALIQEAEGEVFGNGELGDAFEETIKGFVEERAAEDRCEVGGGSGVLAGAELQDRTKVELIGAVGVAFQRRGRVSFGFGGGSIERRAQKGEIFPGNQEAVALGPVAFGSAENGAQRTGGVRIDLHQVVERPRGEFAATSAGRSGEVEFEVVDGGGFQLGRGPEGGEFDFARSQGFDLAKVGEMAVGGA